MKEAIRTLERRVNQLGVAEPVIAEHGAAHDQILVQLPGVTDVEQAKRVIKTTAQLSLKLVEDSAPSRETLLQTHGGKVPANMEVVQGQGEEAGVPVFYLVRREAIITGRDLKNARGGVDENNQPDVQFSLNAAGADKFKRETGRNVGKQLAIILDGTVASAPVIQSADRGRGAHQRPLHHRGDRRAVQGAARGRAARHPALPAGADGGRVAGQGLDPPGRDGRRRGHGLHHHLHARVLPAVGVNAVVALAANLLILLGAMAYSGATLTLPGIAGIILTVGVGVDTNVLVFERIREELRNGKTVRAAIQNGFDRVWITILDTHATALIAAAFLFQFGTGPIKGFAVTLVMGLIANIFASYFVSKFLFEWVLGKRQVTTEQFSI